MNKFICEFDMLHDGHFNANVKIKSFVVKDTRVNTDSKFPVIIPSVDGVDNQFTLLVTTEGPAESRNITAMLTIEKPQTILALDYLFEVQLFINKAIEQEASPPFAERPRQQSRTSITTSSAKF